MVVAEVNGHVLEYEDEQEEVYRCSNCGMIQSTQDAFKIYRCTN